MVHRQIRSRSGRRLSSLVVGVIALACVSAPAATAANNPGTGDSGFFTFRPADGVGGTQINVASGNALVRTRDLADGPLTYHVVVDRFYNSLDAESYTILSPRWAFDVGPDTTLTVESNQDATVRGPSGYRIRFEQQPDGSYVGPKGFDGSLVKTASGWTLSRASVGDEFGFDGSGNLTWTKDSELRDFTVQGTSAAGRTVLSSYGTSSGRRVNLSYATSGDYFVRLMDDPASGHHYYRYTGGRLTEYESPTGAKTTYGYDANGLLDEIVEPGGTTVALDVAASGKVHSITTTLPGGVPQTTSFVYARRPYKTDVTAPDTTRRTYAYDDDWRVTRDYDPDVVPTVTASGELLDLADDYVGPNRTYPLTVAADQPDGAGLRRLLVERSNGTEIEGEDVPCTTTPFDLVCPTSRTTNLDVSFANVPEGEQTIRAAADDDEEHHATSDGWKVLVDKTPPTAASDFQLSYFDPSDPTASATITWAMPEDPDLPGDVPGSGVVRTEARYRVGSGGFSPWIESGAPTGNEDGEDEVDDGSLAFFGGLAGQQVLVEVRAVDAVGNTSATASGTVTLAEQLEDPEVEAMAVEYYIEEYGGSEGVAREWLAVQDRTDGLGPAVSAALPSGTYAGIWLDNVTRRIKVGVKTGTSTTGVQQVLVGRGLAARTDVVPVAHSQGALEAAQNDLEADLDDLLGEIELARDPSLNRIEIEASTALSLVDRQRVEDAAAAAGVAVAIIDVDPEDLEAEPAACKFPYCDDPLRGGVGIGPEWRANGKYERWCTAGFNATRSDGLKVLVTAGHCFSEEKEREPDWRTVNAKRTFRPFLGRFVAPYFYSGSGDAGMLRLTDRYTKPAGRTASVFVTKSHDPGTIRDTTYPIRGIGASSKGRILCLTGSTNGSRCFKVDKLNATATYKDPDVKVRHLGRGVGCGVAHGDSGGPVYKGNLAFGIVSGKNKKSLFQPCRVYYQGAAGVQDLLNVDIATRR